MTRAMAASLRHLLPLGFLPASACALAQTAAPSFPDAQASDPVALGWMKGFAPPPDRVIRFAEGRSKHFPQLRWSFPNDHRHLVPTSNVSRGLCAPTPLPRTEHDDIDAVTFRGRCSDQTMTWAQALAANYTDGIVVMPKGRIVYERCFGALRPDGQHIAMSVTQSFFGTIGAMLVADGTLDANAKVAQYVPELKDAAFGDATVRQVLDMTAGRQYSEDYAGPKAEMLIARCTSHPLTGNANFDPTSLPAYHALARHLMANPR